MPPAGREGIGPDQVVGERHRENLPIRRLQPGEVGQSMDVGIRGRRFDGGAGELVAESPLRVAALV